MVSSRIFRSRWSALFWAGGILWTAYDVAGAAPSDHGRRDDHGSGAALQDATGEAVSDADLATLANAMGR